jgi:hypothetical protein
MARSQTVALMFLGGAMLVGGTAGVAVDRYMMRDRICPVRSGERGYRGVFFSELGFTPDQRAAWDSILDERSRRVRAVFEPVQTKADSIRESFRPFLLQLLTDEQRVKLAEREKMIREQRERWSRDRKPPSEN